MASFVISKPTLSSPYLAQQRSSYLRGTEKASILSTTISRSRRDLISRVKCAMGAPYEGNVPKFPRTNVGDPYKRLGISRYASEEELWASRNFLLEQYAGHERSEESIEDAFERLLMKSFKQKRKAKFNLKTKLKKKVQEAPPMLKGLLNCMELPPMEVIFRRFFLFAFMAGWSIKNSADGGPAFQVGVSLAACIYFLNEKSKNLKRAMTICGIALVIGLFLGSVAVPLIPAAIPPPTWTLELMTSLVVYLFLFLFCTFFK